MTWKLDKAATTPTYKNPKTIRKIIFNDRLNTNYSVSDEPLENHIIGNTPTYKDYIKNALDPNIDSNKNVYGIAKKLEPLTNRINAMRASIDDANAAYFDLKKRVQEQQEQQAEPAKEPAKQEAKIESKGEPSNVQQ